MRAQCDDMAEDGATGMGIAREGGGACGRWEEGRKKEEKRKKNVDKWAYSWHILKCIILFYGICSAWHIFSLKSRLRAFKS
jgi:D-alanyl-lipoteichoic acid acyltransferase DltB (MBOAT superfamily)